MSSSEIRANCLNLLLNASDPLSAPLIPIDEENVVPPPSSFASIGDFQSFFAPLLQEEARESYRQHYPTCQSPQVPWRCTVLHSERVFVPSDSSPKSSAADGIGENVIAESLTRVHLHVNRARQVEYAATFRYRRPSCTVFQRTY